MSTPIALPDYTFSILERIDVGETWSSRLRSSLEFLTFSILERIDVGETGRFSGGKTSVAYLSVSSNGSTWVKPVARLPHGIATAAFSILERIDVGETILSARGPVSPAGPFSILERIDVGETIRGLTWISRMWSFSILERIDVGETFLRVLALLFPLAFQYPRTDRRG